MSLLNQISADPGSRKPRVRVGRGQGSGLGKTCGKGHKGQHARSGGYHKLGFEGGQKPLKQRLPKFGFNSALKATRAEVTFEQLETFVGDVVDLFSLKTQKIISARAEVVKVIATGELNKSLVFRGVKCSAGALEAIQKAGGTVE